MMITRNIVGLWTLAALIGQPGFSQTERYVLEARSLMGRGRPSEAMELVRSCIDARDQPETVYNLLVESGQYAGRADEVALFLHTRIREGKGVIRGMSALGNLYMCGARWREAYEQFERSLALGDRSARTFAGLEGSYEKLYGTPDAVAHLLALTHTEAKNGGLWYALALLYWSEWDLPRALSAVDQAVAVGMHDALVFQLRAGILCSLKPDAGHRSLARTELENAIMRVDPDGEAFMRWVLMTAFDASGYPDSSSVMQREASRLVRERGQLAWLGYFTLGEARDQLADGNVQGALTLTDSATVDFERAGDHDGVLSAHSLRMSTLFESGRYPEGLDYCFRILGQLDAHSDPRLLAGASIDAAWIFSRIGAQRLALILGIRAESILERISSPTHDYCRLNCTLGLIHSALGDHALARRYLYSALRSAETSTPGGQLHASCEGSVGDFLLTVGDTLQARKHYRNQWEIAERIANRGEQKTAALSLARTTDLRSAPGDVERWARTALRLSTLVGDRSSERECHVLLGRIAEARGKRMVARREYECAAGCLEALRPLRHTCALMRETREWYVEQHSETIQALVRSGAMTEAVGLLERARSDVDLHVYARMEKAANDALPAGARDLLRRQRYVSASLHRWVFDTSLDRVTFCDSAMCCLGEFFVRDAPLLGRLLSHAPLDEPVRSSGTWMDNPLAARIPSGEVFIDVLFGKLQSEIFTMTKEGFSHRTIDAGRSWFAPRIEALTVMGASLPRIPGEKAGLSEEIAGSQLADSLLQSVAGVIRPHMRVVIIGDGLQSCIPFEALTLTGQGRNAPLVESCEVTYRPSMWESRHALDPPNSSEARLLVLADAAWAGETDQPSRETIDRVLAGHTGPRVHDDLPGGRAEIAMLQDMFGSRVDIRMGPEASKETFMGSAPGYSILHVSTHSAVRNQEYPEHVLFLSPSRASNGEVGVADILSLDLSTSLVVLPSCYSARSSEVGDIESLAHAFLDAGAGSVLAARWPLDDRLAVVFLREFYAALTEGCDRSTAARRGMLALKGMGYSDRLVWAGFQLFGEPGPLSGFETAGASQDHRWWPALLVSGGVLSVSIGLLWRRRKFIRSSHPDRKRRE